MSLPESPNISTANTDPSEVDSKLGNDPKLKSKERDRLAKIRAHFDRSPYPRQALESQPTPLNRYQHCLVTAYHRRYQKLIDTQGMRILDVGCGSGYGSLTLALANPGTTVVGVDLSPASIDLAQKRMDHYGFGDRSRFEVLSLENLDQLLPEKFDYINCDELLYLQPDPAVGLAAMKTVLADDGIIRTNLHNRLQRAYFFRAQELFHLMGLMDGNPGEMEVEVVRELFEALRNSTLLKKATWSSGKADIEEYFMMNYLFHGDRGFTVPEMLDCTERAELDWVSMVGWQSWCIEDLLRDPDDMPAFLAMGLSMASEGEKLHIHDLLASEHRLLDFWCGHPEANREFLGVEEWEPHHWQTARGARNPQINNEKFKAGLREAVTGFNDLQMRRFFNVIWGMETISGAIVIGLIPLLDGAKTFAELVDYWKKVCPIDSVSLAPTTTEQASAPLRYLLTELAKWGYVLPEQMD